MKDKRVLLAAVGFVVLVFAAFYIFRDSLPSTNRHAIKIEDCNVTTESDISAKESDEVTLLVTSDEAGEFHIHGYDLKRDLEKGVEEKITFKASEPGKYTYEIHDLCEELGTITITDFQGNVPEAETEEHSEEEATSSAEEDQPHE